MSWTQFLVTVVIYALNNKENLSWRLNDAHQGDFGGEGTYDLEQP